MKTYLILVFCIITVKVFGTAQIPDKLIFENKEYSLHTNPLEEYFDQHPDKRPTSGINSTALWRGYVATFEIINNELLVKDIEIMYMDEDDTIKWKSIYNEIFPDEPLKKVDWMIGILVAPYGKLKNYVHMGYGSTYSDYLLFSCQNGNITESRKMNYKKYEEFKDKQFKAFKKTEEYLKIKQELMENSSEYNEEFIDGFLRNFVVSYTSKFLD